MARDSITGSPHVICTFSGCFRDPQTVFTIDIWTTMDSSIPQAPQPTDGPTNLPTTSISTSNINREWSSTTPNHLTPTAASTTLSSPAFTSYLTPTAAPSQIHDHKIPVVVIVCISTAFVLTTAIVVIIRRLRRIQHIQVGEAQSTILSIDTPQPSPTSGEAPNEQQPSPSDNVDRTLPRPMTKRQRTQRDQRPFFGSHTGEINSRVGSLRLMEQLSRRGLRIVPAERSAEMEQQVAALHACVQQLSGQYEHLQRQLVHANGAQGVFDDEEPPAYI